MTAASTIFGGAQLISTAVYAAYGDVPLTKPSRATHAFVDLWGGNGCTSGDASNGGYAGGLVDLAGIDSLFLTIGGGGDGYAASHLGGYNGGGGGQSGYNGGAGGYSALFVSSARTVANLLLMAGGGGAGYRSHGGGLMGLGPNPGTQTGGYQSVGLFNGYGYGTISQGDGNSVFGAGGGGFYGGGPNPSLGNGVPGSGGSGYVASNVRHGKLLAGTDSDRANIGSDYVTPSKQWSGNSYGGFDGEGIVRWYAGNPFDNGLLVA